MRQWPESFDSLNLKNKMPPPSLMLESMREQTMEWMWKYGYIITGIGLFLAFFVAVFFFQRRHSSVDDKKVGIGWYLLLGPFAFIKWHARRTGKNMLLTKRETIGWMVVLVLMLIIFLWEITSNNL
jgi:uncharacterized membrane protein